MLQVLTNGYRLTEEGEKDLVSKELRATAHIKRRSTESKPHGQSLGPLISRHLKVPEIFTKPAVAPPIDRDLDVLSHIQPYKMEKIDMMEVPECLQDKVKKIFMDSLDYVHTYKYKKGGAMKRQKEPYILENLQTKLKHDVVKKKVDTFLEEDQHPYIFGCNLQEGISEMDPSVMFMNDLQSKLYEDPRGKFLGTQKRFEKEKERRMKQERMEGFASLTKELKWKDAAKLKIVQNMEAGRRYLGNNLLNRRMRIERMKSTIKKLKGLENKMAQMTGMDDQTKEKMEMLKEKVDKLQDIVLHDFTVRYKKAVGYRFWKPLFGKEEDELADEE